MKRTQRPIKEKIIHESTPERLNAFSDGVFAIVITIMILELKRPSRPTFEALSISARKKVDTPNQANRLFHIRSIYTNLIFGSAMVVALWHPYIGFGMICLCLTLYLRPEVPGMRQ